MAETTGTGGSVDGGAGAIERRGEYPGSPMSRPAGWGSPPPSPPLPTIYHAVRRRCRTTAAPPFSAGTRGPVVLIRKANDNKKAADLVRAINGMLLMFECIVCKEKPQPPARLLDFRQCSVCLAMCCSFCYGHLQPAPDTKKCPQCRAPNFGTGSGVPRLRANVILDHLNDVFCEHCGLVHVDDDECALKPCPHSSLGCTGVGRQHLETCKYAQLVDLAKELNVTLAQNVGTSAAVDMTDDWE